MNKKFVKNIFKEIKNKTPNKYIFIHISLVKDEKTKKIFYTFLNDNRNDLIIKNTIKKLLIKRKYFTLW